MHKSVLIGLATAALALAACGGGGGGDGAGDVARGEALFKQSTIGTASAPGCSTCHTLDGSALVGPSQQGLVGRAEAAIASAEYAGTATTVEEYIKESITNPDVFLEEGFAAGVMYQNYGTELTEQEIADLVAFLATLK
ncbi:MAG TPA: c-type cytochrome [Anaerolineales bacterium]|nr:c-type cytochrome [Anaerolineales bacterium]